MSSLVHLGCESGLTVAGHVQEFLYADYDTFVCEQFNGIIAGGTTFTAGSQTIFDRIGMWVVTVQLTQNDSASFGTDFIVRLADLSNKDIDIWGCGGAFSPYRRTFLLRITNKGATLNLVNVGALAATSALRVSRCSKFVGR